MNPKLRAFELSQYHNPEPRLTFTDPVFAQTCTAKLPFGRLQQPLQRLASALCLGQSDICTSGGCLPADVWR